MAQTYGNLEKKDHESLVLMGALAIPGVISGGIAIGERTDMPEGSKLWPLEVKIREGGQWASLGNAKFERKNPQSNWYLRVVIESPIIQAKLGQALWLRGFPDSEDKGEEPQGADNYDLVWGNGGGKKAKPDNFKLDDEIPF